MYTGAIIGAIIGGIFGFVGFLVSKKLVKDKKKVQTITLILIAGVSGGIMPLINSPSVQKKIMPLISDDYAFQLDFQNNVLSHISNSQYQLEIEDMSMETTQRLTQKGLARLTDEQVKKWNESRLMLANKSLPLCSALWDGDFSNVDYVEIMRGLDEKQLADWVEISAAALEAELAESIVSSPNNDQLQTAMQRFNESFSEKDKQRAQLTFAKGLGASKDDGCWLMKSIMSYANEDQTHGLQVSRWLASMASQSVK
tara:strand:+ start:52814 stop:53581 length:768 start_codon:yes stop_codon:yes gene_type:complete